MIKQWPLVFGLFLGSLGAALFAGVYSGGSGTSADPYRIASKADLLELAVTQDDYSNCFILIADIDLAGETFTRAIIAPDPGDSIVIDPGNWKKTVVFQGIAFTGTFDGNDHQIRNLIIDKTEGGNLNGLFGYIGVSGHIKNLTLSSASIQGNEFTGILAGFNAGDVIYCTCAGTVNGDQVGGGLAGGNSGTISHSHCQVNIDGTDTWGGLVGQNEGIIQSCYSAGAIVGFWDIGGLAGDNYGTILYSYSTGVITIYNASYSECVGGLVGWNDNGSIFNCYSSNTITAEGNYASYYGGLVGDNSGIINRCYSTGQVTVGENAEYIGGLAGYTAAETITSCFWDTQTSGQTESAGGTGMTTAQMKTLLTYTAARWDFAGETANGTSDIWRMCTDGLDYPRLNWESTTGDFACPDGVSTEDLNYFVEQWLLANCTTDNNYCGGTDLDSSGTVNMADLALFAAHWLDQ